MDLDAATIARYQSGGDIYQLILAQYGQSAADNIASVAQGGSRSDIANALATLKYGPALDTSTADAFANQILTDPLGAPLAGLNTALANSFTDFLKSPAVLLTLGIVAFVALGGLNLLKIKSK